MSFKNAQSWFSKRDKFLIIGQLEEKDEKFGDKCSQKPHENLNQPNFDVNLIVRVKVFWVVNRHAFVCIYSTFEHLYFKFYRNIVNNPENDIANGKTDDWVINDCDQVPGAPVAWLGHLLQIKGQKNVQTMSEAHLKQLFPNV